MSDLKLIIIKIMKTINAIIILSLLIFIGCKPNLDIEPSGAPRSVFNSPEGALKAANAMYENFDGEEFYGGGLMWYINASDDFVTGREDSQAEIVRAFGAGASTMSYLQGQWLLRYTTITRANAVLREVPKIAFSDQKLKNRILGEAYFLSALMYYELAYNYGNEKAGVPLIDPQAEITGKTVPRAPNVRQNYDSIIKWFNRVYLKIF
ncbi:MAG: hypothetical protein CRN43_17680 [Candidatus Nephrothrix sp. EaCA]|nr:MAG: hypothetical protein CRN43_17680 [Candidatus Nephrothrix sp. EaCA]